MTPASQEENPWRQNIIQLKMSFELPLEWGQRAQEASQFDKKHKVIQQYLHQ